MLQRNQHGLLPTFDEYQKQPGNENKIFNDYLLAYFAEEAKPLFLKVMANWNDLSFISRITNNLRTVHPDLSNELIVHQFLSVVDNIDDDDARFGEDKIKRWFYGSVNLVAQLFLTHDGKLKNKFLRLFISEQYPTLADVTKALYGDPENSQRVAAIATQIIGSAVVGICQILASDPAISQIEHYRDIAYGPQENEDDLRLLPLSKELNFQRLQEAQHEDFYLCRVNLFRAEKNFLSKVNRLLPPAEQIANLDTDLNAMLNQLILHSPMAGTRDYNHFYLRNLDSLNKYLEKLAEELPQASSALLEAKALGVTMAFHTVRLENEPRTPKLLDFANQLDRIYEEIKAHLDHKIGPRA